MGVHQNEGGSQRGKVGFARLWKKNLAEALQENLEVHDEYRQIDELEQHLRAGDLELTKAERAFLRDLCKRSWKSK